MGPGRNGDLCDLYSYATADSHALHYYSFGVSAPRSSEFHFSIVGYVDDQQIESYSSNMRRCVPVAHWMKKNETTEFWERRTQSNKLHEAFFRHEMLQWQKKFNHTEGLHFLQVMTGCELGDDGSFISYRRFRYDGEEYMHFDLPTGSFIPTMVEAETLTQRWNTKSVGFGMNTKHCLKNECLERLKMYIEYGREDLERRVQPKVQVTHRESGAWTKLHCVVYGFHPRAVDVKWMKNKIDDVPSYETTGVLPNPDGTYQIRVSAEVIPKEGDSYSCYVDHRSLGEPLLVRWEPEQDYGSPRAVIIGAAAIIVLVLTSIVLGFLIYRKMKDPYMAAPNVEMREAEELPMT